MVSGLDASRSRALGLDARAPDAHGAAEHGFVAHGAGAAGLDAAAMRVIANQLAFLLRGNCYIHTGTVDAWNWLCLSQTSVT
jgi:hypothetical protein